MKDSIRKVQEFQPIGRVKDFPTLLSDEDSLFRFSLGYEELYEYKEACENKDIVAVADALGDQLYIIFGTILSHGMQHIIQEVFDEIHRSNMSKFGEDGKPVLREDGKILKGPNYSPPDLSKFIERGI